MALAKVRTGSTFRGHYRDLLLTAQSGLLPEVGAHEVVVDGKLNMQCYNEASSVDVQPGALFPQRPDR